MKRKNKLTYDELEREYYTASMQINVLQNREIMLIHALTEIRDKKTNVIDVAYDIANDTLKKLKEGK